ncbi:MBL fold metallo-hydrolase [Rhizorhabdus dicambivorans]|uniref:MBL fold metallo-hydrolase n=1 Tax=Rhizorhabdus dicambivorans TaxID=1850238 RepID=A0A2A4FQG0_9SPHN|nr:MBL fold metallo-hydrolase [Rhizorhabdus dicambivorans]ATE64658.1 MBL fold metallo-hydrolase [Rhizorhabdus dicambivorans]PCE39641.1 MBL fold metallo-hydrolase [Rhizorhabdus dicambivorans]
MSEAVAGTDAFRRWTVGDIRITRILELPPMAFDPADFLQTTREEVLRRRAWLVPDYATEAGDIILHFQAFIIEAGGKRIMVDPCIGNGKPRVPAALDMLDTPFLQRLESAGFPRESIDFVLCTHLHVDHCGWNTMLVDGRWVPTFPNARYFFARGEFEHARVDGSDPNARAIFEDSVQPIVDAGLADLIEPDHPIVEGVRLEATPGHTPGHCSVVISSGGQQAILTGDVIHHPIQTSMPDVSSNFCWDGEIGRATRRAMLERVAAARAIMIPPHFAGPTGVYLTPDGEAWRVEEA